MIEENSTTTTTMTPDPAFLLAISLSSDSESESDSDSVPGETSANVDRTALSEQAFQALKATYKPKVENGEVCYQSIHYITHLYAHISHPSSTPSANPPQK